MPFSLDDLFRFSDDEGGLGVGGSVSLPFPPRPAPARLAPARQQAEASTRPHVQQPPAGDDPEFIHEPPCEVCEHLGRSCTGRTPGGGCYYCRDQKKKCTCTREGLGGPRPGSMSQKKLGKRKARGDGEERADEEEASVEPSPAEPAPKPVRRVRQSKPAGPSKKAKSRSAPDQQGTSAGAGPSNALGGPGSPVSRVRWQDSEDHPPLQNRRRGLDTPPVRYNPPAPANLPAQVDLPASSSAVQAASPPTAPAPLAPAPAPTGTAVCTPPEVLPDLLMHLEPISHSQLPPGEAWYVPLEKLYACVGYATTMAIDTTRTPEQHEAYRDMENLLSALARHRQHFGKRR